MSYFPPDRHFEGVSTYETLPKRARYNRVLLGQFTNKWKNEYLPNMMEAYKPKDPTKEPIVSVGGMLLKDDQNKISFWKLCKIVNIFPGPMVKLGQQRFALHFQHAHLKTRYYEDH